MKIVEKEIEKNGEKIFICMDEVLLTEYEVGRFDEAQIRELIVYLKKNRPELICPIMCEDCAENNVRVASHNYFYCAREHGENSK